jgi:AraC family transcriptional regulator of adaptative response / DNA-3-methyladenine glycosylase II
MRQKCLDNDSRFDGIFYSCVTTTKIYCRSTCPGVPPKEANNRFVRSKAEAEEAGFRPCLRCRPETAPPPPLDDDSNWHINTTLDKIHEGHFIQEKTKQKQGVDNTIDFLTATGVSLEKYGKTFQLGFAKTLFTDTSLSAGDIARITGFSSARDMTDGLHDLYRRDPTKVRKPLTVSTHTYAKSCALHLCYRSPYDWAGLLKHFSARMILGTEWVTHDKYMRTFSLQGAQGWFCVSDECNINALKIEIHTTDLQCLMPLISRVRKMFDLDADPLRIEQSFKNDSVLGHAWTQQPGIRVPACWDPLEAVVRAVAGQLISVKAAITIVGNIVDQNGEKLSFESPEGLENIFPEASCLLKMTQGSTGLTRNKEKTIFNVAKAIVSGEIDFQNVFDLETLFSQLTAVKGIGEWTANSVIMRGLGAKDVFPSGDLGIKKAFSKHFGTENATIMKKTAMRWSPLRSYAGTFFWAMQ